MEVNLALQRDDTHFPQHTRCHRAHNLRQYHLVLEYMKKKETKNQKKIKTKKNTKQNKKKRKKKQTNNKNKQKAHTPEDHYHDKYGSDDDPQPHVLPPAHTNQKRM